MQFRRALPLGYQKMGDRHMDLPIKTLIHQQSGINFGAVVAVAISHGSWLKRYSGLNRHASRDPQGHRK